MILGVDIETCSAADIRDGAAPYAEHPSTRVWVVVFAMASRGTGAHKVFRWFPGEELPAWIVEHIADGGLLLAHNASFEQSIWTYILRPQHRFPSIPLDQWRDSLAIAASNNLPLGLAHLGAALGATVLKDDEGRKLMLSLASVKKVGDQFVYPEPTDVEMTRLADYCELDVLAMLDCYWRMPGLPPDEDAMIIEDRRINTRGARLDVPLAAALQAMAAKRELQLAREIWDRTQDLLGLTNVPAFTAWLEEQGVVLPKVLRKKKDGTFHATRSVDRASMMQVLAYPDLPAAVREAIHLRTEAGRVTSLAKAARVPSVVNGDGRLRHAFRYSKANTGRWTSEIFQLHNLARPTKEFRAVAEPFAAAVLAGDIDAAIAIYPALLDGLSFLLRSLVVADEGYELVGGDFAAIEARVLAWVAGQDDVLRLFASGADVYTADAKAIGSDNRQLGKVQRLGLGYGMGAIKFRDTAAKAGVELTLKRAREVQLGWRKNNAAIVAFWHALQNGAATCIEDPTREVAVGKVRMRANAKCLSILLPSGRRLRYWRPTQRDVMREIETVDREGNIITDSVMMRELRFFRPGKLGMEAETTYGGKLAENVVQAISRDLLRDALLNLSATPYRVVVHVHDSIAAEVPVGTGSVDEFCKLMAVAPSWASDLPIAVEGYRSRHFKG